MSDPGSEFFMLDTTEGNDILDARRLNMTGEPERGADLSHPAFSAAGSRFTVLEQFHHDGERPRSLWEIDVNSGRKLDRLIKTDLQIEDFAVSREGAYYLMATIIYGYEGPGNGRTMYLWDGDGEPEAISTGASEVAW